MHLRRNTFRHNRAVQRMYLYKNRREKIRKDEKRKFIEFRL